MPDLNKIPIISSSNITCCEILARTTAHQYPYGEGITSRVGRTLTCLFIDVEIYYVIIMIMVMPDLNKISLISPTHPFQAQAKVESNARSFVFGTKKY